MIEELQRQMAALKEENQKLSREKMEEMKKWKEEKQKLQEEKGQEIESLKNLVQDKNKEIESLKKENEELREQWKSEQFKQKKQNFLKKTQEPGWERELSSLEDVEFLFEEFEMQELLQPLNDLLKPLNDRREYSFDRLKGLSVGAAVALLKIDHCKASKLVFLFELMGNGIYSKEDKEKHLKNCSICRMDVKKGLEEYGVAAKDSAAIAEKFPGMHVGEIKNLTMVDFLNLGMEASVSFELGEYFSFPKWSFGRH